VVDALLVLPCAYTAALHHDSARAACVNNRRWREQEAHRAWRSARTSPLRNSRGVWQAPACCNRQAWWPANERHRWLHYSSFRETNRVHLPRT